MANQIIFGANIVPANAAMEVSINGGTTFTPLAFTAAGSILQGTLTGVPAGTYAAGQLIVGAVGYINTRIPGPAITVLAATTTIVPILANYGLNGGILRTNTAGQNLHAGLSRLQINLNGATSGTLNVFSTGGSANVLAYDGTTLLGEQLAGANSLTGLSGGTLTLYMGGQQRSFEQGDVTGADVTSFVFPGSSVGSFIAPSQTTRAVAVFGDSISNGATLAFSQRDAFSALIRSARNSSTVLGYGSGTASVMFDPANYATLLKPRLQAIWGGATEQAGVLLIGTNDYGGSGGGTAANGGLSAADLQTRLTSAFTSITTDFPNAKLLLITPLYRSDETSLNSYNLTLPAYRTAETAATANFPAITARDGRGLLVPGPSTDYAADGIHPSAAGHQKIFNFAAPAIDSLFTTATTGLVDLATLAAVSWIENNNATLATTTLTKAAGSGSTTWNGGAIGNFRLGTTTGAGVKGQVHIPGSLIVHDGNVNNSSVLGLSANRVDYTRVDANGNSVAFVTISTAFYWDGVKYGLIEAGQALPFVTVPWPADGSKPDFDMQLTDSVINYYVGRKLFYTSAFNPVPSLPLFVCCTLFSAGLSKADGITVSSVNQVPVTAAAAATGPVAVTWSNGRSVTVVASAAGGAQLKSLTNTVTTWSSGGSSKQAVGAVASPAAGVEIGRLTFPNVAPTTDANGGWVAGLSDVASTTPPFYTSVRYGFYRDNTYLRVFQLGTVAYQAAFPAGTPTLAILIFPTYISYTVNGTEVFRNTSTPVLPLFAEADFNLGGSPGCYVENVTISAQNPVFSPYQA